ncbi:MAG: sulfite exporter TauE/SafE family protein [Spirochaetales bacterium]|nr:sulfite exporter TauE/SafE family protein [Spirochaetales bacterium]
MLQISFYLLLGLIAGVISGIVGIGGGIIIVPALIFLFGFSQHQAQGTTLALMVPPIGFLAAYTYFKNGYVNIKISIIICIGFFIGGLIGSRLAIHIPNQILQKIFGAVMLAIGVYMIIPKK